MAQAPFTGFNNQAWIADLLARSRYGTDARGVGGERMGYGPGGPMENWDGNGLPPDQLGLILKAIWRMGRLITIPFTVGTVSVELLPQQDSRYYLLIVNTSAANQMFLGLGHGATANDLPLAINLGFYEPLVVPSDSINVLGAAAATTGVLIYAS